MVCPICAAKAESKDDEQPYAQKDKAEKND